MTHPADHTAFVTTPSGRPPGPGPASHPGRSADPREVERFDRLSHTWWDATGPMRPLHVTNALRAPLVAQMLQDHLAPGGPGLAGLKVLDMGCGAGLLSEALAARGARVTGLDASPRNIEIARRHAAQGGLEVDYRHGEADGPLEPGERFDAVMLLEVVEHVDDVPAFVQAAARHLRPGGLLIASTINRNFASWCMAIVGAEWVLRLLPRGTHQWRRFVTPAELASAGAGAGLAPLHWRGMRYLPFVHRASWCSSLAVNYLGVFRKQADGPLPIPPGAGR